MTLIPARFRGVDRQQFVALCLAAHKRGLAVELAAVLREAMQMALVLT